MKMLFLVIGTLLCYKISFGQKTETIYLNPADSTTNMYIAVIPEGKPRAFLFLLDGMGANPKGVMIQSNIPSYAAANGILTIIPVLKTGPMYFGADEASQQSLNEQIEDVVERYKLAGVDFFIGGFSIGGTCAIKYAEVAARSNSMLKPKAVFGVDCPLDWERYYNAAQRLVRQSPSPVNDEITYMIDRIEKEIKGTPQTALKNFHNISPYSFSDLSQRAVRTLADTAVMMIVEPDIQWWMENRGYDYSLMNATDIVAMINELHKLGNNKSVLVTTIDKGYRQPGNIRHPHSWSIADPQRVIEWLKAQ